MSPPGHRDGGDAASSTLPDTGTPVEAGDPGTVDITLTVTASQNARAISPLIYGVNDAAQAAAVHSTIVRTGGNRLTAFNWENNASNGGSDYQYENDDFLCGTTKCVPSNDAPGAYYKAVIDQASAAGAATLITVPIVDYVSADKSPAGDVRNSGAGYLQTRFRQNKAAKGSAFADPPDTTDGVVYQDEMVHWLTVHEPSATLLYQLDNEPDLWSGTHPEVYPSAVTYADLVARNIATATAIKAVSPSAIVVGPVDYGWSGYVSLQAAPDSKANGDWVEYYLTQMKAAEQTAGKRLVDTLDLHWYPEATGGGIRIIDDGTGAAEVAAREQAPRSLWDSTYVETSWITQSLSNKAIDLIPLMQGKIASKYPGTGLSFSEWNYGGGTDISGAVASADVLGIFGTSGVTMAMMWPSSTGETFTYAAFKAYRNYDGKGAAFGDTSIGATTSDVPDSSVYASLDSSDVSKMVVVAINKATTSKKVGIVVNHSVVYSTASVYTITAGGGPAVVAASPITAVGTNAFTLDMAAQSIAVIVPKP